MGTAVRAEPAGRSDVTSPAGAKQSVLFPGDGGTAGRVPRAPETACKNPALAIYNRLTEDVNSAQVFFLIFFISRLICALLRSIVTLKFGTCGDEMRM